VAILEVCSHSCPVSCYLYYMTAFIGKLMNPSYWRRGNCCLHHLGVSGREAVQDKVVFCTVWHIKTDDEMIIFTWLYMYNIMCTLNIMYMHHLNQWCKLLLLKRLSNWSATHILCLFIISSIYFLLSQLYYVGRQSTQPQSFSSLSLVNRTWGRHTWKLCQCESYLSAVECKR
jgi:hypothetical protein